MVIFENNIPSTFCHYIQIVAKLEEGSEGPFSPFGNIHGVIDCDRQTCELTGLCEKKKSASFVSFLSDEEVCAPAVKYTK